MIATLTGTVWLAVMAQDLPTADISASTGSAVIIDRVVRNYSPSGDIRSTEIETETNRADGTRHLRSTNVFRSAGPDGKVEAYERWHLFDAAERVLYSVYPSIQMYGKLPQSSTQFQPVKPVPYCPDVMQGWPRMTLLETETKFGATAHTYETDVTTRNTSQRLVGRKYT